MSGVEKCCGEIYAEKGKRVMGVLLWIRVVRKIHSDLVALKQNLK